MSVCKNINYISATGIFKTSVFMREIENFLYNNIIKRNKIIGDLLVRLTSEERCSSSDIYPCDINNPLTYYKVYETLNLSKEYYIKAIIEVLKEFDFKINEMNLEKKSDFDFWREKYWESVESIEILDILFNKYCETDWRGVISNDFE